MTNSTEFRIWQGMLNRCRNKKVRRYEQYGGRGIKVCGRWLKFENFFADMGARPSKAHSLDRINSNGNYEPSNVRWADKIDQANNKRRTRMVVYRGQSMPLAEAVRAAGSIVHIEAANTRLKSGWAVEKALETPTSRRKKRSDERHAVYLAEVAA